jgi:hypothetical protein
MSTYAFVIFALLWIGLVLSLVVNRDWPDLAWNWVQALPSAARIAVWVAWLPIMTGLWIWQSSWPALGRLLAFAGLVAWNLLAVSSLVRALK